MYTGEEIIHTIASKNLSFATGWLFLSIALGSVLTFTFFAAISTTFFCCQKPIKKNDTQGLIHSGNSAQKLLFPNVPSTVYPTIQSIFQQEDNEVIDSLSPAYRELPSTHFSYVSSFNASITSCCGNNETPILPNSTETSVQPHTSSLSSEQLNIQRLSNDTTTAQQNANNTMSNSSISINMASTAKEATILKQSPSPTNPDIINDSSQSIHIIRAIEDTRQFLMSTTSGIITEEDVTVQREINQDTIQVIEPTVHDGQLNEPAMNDDQRLDEPVMTGGQLKEPVINDQRLNESAANDQRLCAEIYGPIKNASTTPAKNTNHNASDSLRGASSFGAVELSPKARAFSPDYYALTFRREGSGLSDVSCSSLRGASAFAGSSQRSPVCSQRSPVCSQRSPVMTSHVHERGASVFGQISERLHPNGSFIINETRKQLHIQSEFLELTHESLSNHKGSEVERSCTRKETRDEPSSCTHAVKISPSQSPNHSVAEISVNSVHSVEANSSKLQCENQNMESIIKFPTYKDISAVSTINRRPNSYPSTKPYRTNVELGERTTGIRSSLLNDHRNNYSEKSLTPETYNRSEAKSKKNPITLTNNHTTPQQHETLYKAITTTPRENIAPITIPTYTSRDSNIPIKPLHTKSNSKTPKLNTTYQSLRGASQLGRLGDDDDDVDSDRDAFWDSVSLSFAYESPSEEDAESQFGFKEN